MFVWTDYFPRWWLGVSNEQAPNLVIKNNFGKNSTWYRNHRFSISFNLSMCTVLRHQVELFP